jgi:hypothetical protein
LRGLSGVTEELPADFLFLRARKGGGEKEVSIDKIEAKRVVGLGDGIEEVELVRKKDGGIGELKKDVGLGDDDRLLGERDKEVAVLCGIGVFGDTVIVGKGEDKAVTVVTGGVNSCRIEDTDIGVDKIFFHLLIIPDHTDGGSRA